MEDLRELHKVFLKSELHVGARRPKTIKNYQDNFGLLLEFKADITTEDLTEETMVNFFEWLNTRPRTVGKEQVVRVYKKSSAATVRSKLNTFFKWLALRKHIPVSPFKELPRPKVEYTDKRAFTGEEVGRICHAVNTKILWANLLVKKRNIAMVMFLLLTGVRKNEMIELTLADVNIHKRFVRIRPETSKSGELRIINFSAELVPYMEDYLKYREDYTTTDLWVSSNGDHRFSVNGMKHFTEQLTKETGINCHLHRFRHTFAVNYYLQTKDLLGLKQLMGHSSFKMTMSYLRSISNDPTIQVIKEMVTSEFM